jgi:hypothetical protein
MVQKQKEQLEEWRKNQSLNYFEISSLILISYDAIRKHIRKDFGGNPEINYRLFKLTNLPAFKMSETDVNLYKKTHSIKGSIKQLEHLVSEKFINDWLTDKMLPKPELRLMENDNLKDRNLLYPILKEKVLGLKNTEPLQKSSTSNEIFDFKSFTNFLEDKINSDEDRFLKFIEQNKKDLQKVFGLLNIILDDDPISAIKQIKQIKNNLF